MDKLIIPPKFSLAYAPRPWDMAILQYNPWMEAKRLLVVNTKEEVKTGTKTQVQYETLKSSYDTLLADAVMAVKTAK
jgi:hypothetical protein